MMNDNATPVTNPLPTRGAAPRTPVARNDGADPRPSALIRAGQAVLGVLERIHRFLLPVTRKMFGSTAADNAKMTSPIVLRVGSLNVPLSGSKSARGA